MSETNNIKINIALADNTIVTDINSITSHIESLQRLSKKEIALNLRFDKAKDLAKVANEISAAVGDLGNKIQEASQKFNPSGKLKKAASELEEFDKSFRKFAEGRINNKQAKGLKEYWENLYPDKNRAKSTLSRLAKEYNAFIDNFNNKAIQIEDLPDKVFQAERFKKILSDAKYQGDLLKSPVGTGRYEDYLKAYQKIPSNAGKITLDTSLANAELAKLVNVLAMLEKTATTVPVSANVTEALTKLQEVITKIEEAKNKAKIPIQLNSEMLPKQVAQLSEQIAVLTSGLKDRTKIPIIFDALNVPSQIAAVAERVAVLTSGLKDRGMIPITFDVNSIPSAVKTITTEIERAKHSFLIPVQIKSENIKQIVSEIDGVLNELKKSSNLNAPISIKIDMAALAKDIKALKQRLNSLYSIKKYFHPKIKLDLSEVQAKLSSLRKRLIEFNKSKVTSIKIKADISSVRQSIAQLKEGLKDKEIPAEMAVKIMADNSQFLATVNESLAKLKELKDITVHINSNVRDVIAKEKAQKESKPVEEVNDEWERSKKWEKHLYNKQAKQFPNSKFADVSYDEYSSWYDSRAAQEKAKKQQDKLKEKEANTQNKIENSIKAAEARAKAKEAKELAGDNPEDLYDKLMNNPNAKRGKQEKYYKDLLYMYNRGTWTPEKEVFSKFQQKGLELGILNQATNNNSTVEQLMGLNTNKSSAAKAKAQITEHIKNGAWNELYNELFSKDSWSKINLSDQKRGLAELLKSFNAGQADLSDRQLQAIQKRRSIIDTIDKAAKANMTVPEYKKSLTDTEDEKLISKRNKLVEGLHNLQKGYSDAAVSLSKYNQKAQAEIELIEKIRELDSKLNDKSKALGTIGTVWAGNKPILSTTNFEQNLDKVVNKKRAAETKEKQEYSNRTTELQVQEKFNQEKARIDRENKILKLEQDYNAEVARGNQLMEYGAMITQKQYDAHKKLLEDTRAQHKNLGGDESKLAQSQVLALGSSAAEVNKANAIKNAMSWQGMFFRGADEKVNYLTSSLNTLYTQLNRSPGNKGIKKYVELTEAELTKARKEAEAVQKALDRMNPSKLRSEMGRHFRYIGRAFGFYESYDMLNEAGRTIMNINESMANLRTVMPQLHYDKSEIQEAFKERKPPKNPMTKKSAEAAMWEQQREIISIASQYGNKIEETIESARLWGRMYKEQEMVNLLTAQSAKLAVADNFSVEESTKAVEAAMFQFGMQAKTTAEALAYSNRIIDVYTKLSHNAGVTAQDLAAAVERSGSVAHQAGMSFEFLNALIAQATRSTALSGLTNTSPFMLETA